MNSSTNNITISGSSSVTSLGTTPTNNISVSKSQNLSQSQNPYQYHIRNSISGSTISNPGISSFNGGPRTATTAVESNMEISGGYSTNQHHIRQLLASGNTGVNILLDENNYQNSAQTRPELYQKCNRGSHSSDTSSAYSGSDTMTSVHSSSLDTDEVDLSGLVESVVDSDEDDLAESMDVS